MPDIHVHGPTDDETVMGTIDSTGTAAEFVIADISADGAWLSMSADSAPSLPSWR